MKTDELIPKSSRKRGNENLMEGRYVDMLQRKTAPAVSLASCWPTSDQTPQPASAIPTPTAPPATLAVRSRSTGRRKSIALTKSVAWIAEEAPITNPSDDHRSSGTSRGSLNSADTGPANIIVPRQRMTAQPILNQKAASLCPGFKSCR